MMIRNQLRLKCHVSRPLLPRILKFDVIFHQQLNHNQLDLVPREETAGTCVPAIPKRHTFQIASRPLDAAFDHWIAGRLAYFRKAKCIKFSGVREEFRIHGYGLGGDCDQGACWNYEAIREAVVFVDEPFKGAYMEWISQQAVAG